MSETKRRNKRQKGKEREKGKTERRTWEPAVRCVEG
jgi:hypothetical protein